MNLTKLFETQKVLRDRIGYNEPDRFDKLVLALLVELGECANEWRGFKFWSKYQEPRTKKYVFEDEFHPNENPLLEEYVDGLHFVLELGIEGEIEKLEYYGLTPFGDEVSKQFLQIYYLVTEYQDLPTILNFYVLMQYYLGLGKILGFTWEEIEQAYMDKNKVNHERQEQGY